MVKKEGRVYVVVETRDNGHICTVATSVIFLVYQFVTLSSDLLNYIIFSGSESTTRVNGFSVKLSGA